MSETNRSVYQLACAGAAGAAIALVAVFAMGRSDAYAQAGFPTTGSDSIPAVEIREGSIALVRGQGNQYFVVDRQGNAYPVRFRDQDLTVPVGSSLLRSP